jgi:hypothetical protein
MQFKLLAVAGLDKNSRIERVLFIFMLPALLATLLLLFRLHLKDILLVLLQKIC